VAGKDIAVFHHGQTDVSLEAAFTEAGTKMSWKVQDFVQNY